ncbi:glycosyltransferase 87 family protein, partial [Streptomyces sp. CB03238]|uniref:glycosyltransferase 87 family protein n=1 Tax=Streptomyces sp. CB03238 TaxID=1907777 RepID=UPI0015C4D421
MNVRMSSLSWDVRKARIVVIAVATLALVSKMALAANTRGPADVRFFWGFARAIARTDPVRIYAEQMPWLPVYNHPPLASWMLLGLEWLAQQGVPWRPLIRFPACLADLVTVLLVFAIVRRRAARLRTAVWCAVGAALCPVLVATSGYHGNTDSVAVMFAFAAAYLLVDRGRPLAAGLAAALCVSVKLIPVVAVPLLFATAWRTGGRPVLVRFTAGFAALFLTVWGPVVATVPGGLKANVLEYAGGNFSFWGIVRFARWAGVPEPYVTLLRGDGHFLIVAAIMAVGVWLAWRRPADAPLAVATTLGLLLLLSTASGVQYLAWPAAGLFVVGLWQGVAYGVVVGAVAASVYSGQRPVHWTDTEMAFGALGWAVLALCVASALRTAWKAGPRHAPAEAAPPARHAPSTAPPPAWHAPAPTGTAPAEAPPARAGADAGRAPTAPAAGAPDGASVPGLATSGAAGTATPAPAEAVAAAASPPGGPAPGTPATGDGARARRGAGDGAVVVSAMPAGGGAATGPAARPARGAVPAPGP